MGDKKELGQEETNKGENVQEVLAYIYNVYIFIYLYISAVFFDQRTYILFTQDVTDLLLFILD